MPSFRGTVRDLDFTVSAGWCQAILSGHGDDPNGFPELVATTTDPRIQALLEISFVTGATAEVEYTAGSPNLLTRVKVNRETIPPAAREGEGDEDPAAPAPGEEYRGADHYAAIRLTNLGAGAEAGESTRGAATAAAARAVPTLILDPAALKQFVQDCRAAGVGYGLGAKVKHHGDKPGTGFTRVDCSGFVREAVWRATTPHQDFPDGSVVQREHVQAKGFQHGTPADGLRQDGAVRIAFLRPQDAPSKIGHVVLIHNARTFESHGGVGPDSRPWTNTGWQAKTLVYLLTP